jgi:alpha-glucosidase (family GH31 glycosyl hydrolase)
VPALPFSFIRRSSDYSRSIAASFYLSAGEKLFGCGESFTRLDKRGQKVILWTNDANGVESERIYKPIPFFISSRGYGMFVYSSSPMTFDMGASFHAANILLVGGDELKYKLMPYIYAQAKDSSERGLPMVRALFIEHPNDPGSWTVEDEYLFGSKRSFR